MSKTFRNYSQRRVIFLFLFLFAVISIVHGEGTKQIWPNSGTDPNSNSTFNRTVLAVFGQPGGATSNFATYNATTDQRINIHINAIGERIHMGFNIYSNPGVYFRLRRPDGTYFTNGGSSTPIVVPTSGAGYISSAAQAIAGPAGVAGVTSPTGYTPLTYVSDMVGDWWIEFNGNNTTTWTSKNSGSASYGLEFSFWDISVSDAALTSVINGRVWSKEWNFDVTKPGGGGDPTGSGSCTTCGSKGVIYVYTADSVVDKIDFNTTFLPRAFYIDANSKGCMTTGGSVESNRASRAGKVSYAEYPVFLSQPDVNCYLVGHLPSITSNPEFIGCGVGGPYKIEVSNSHSGQNSIYLELNGAAGYQPGTRDRLLLSVASPGKNFISWDGKDGLGALVNSGTISIVCNYVGGIVHFPVYDAENNSGGLIFSLVSPTAGGVQTRVYFNDRKVTSPAGGVSDTTADAGTTGGVAGGVATHKWGSGAPAPNPTAANWGDVNTINTWIETIYETRTITGVITANCPVVVVNAARCINSYSNGDILSTASDADGAITAASVDSLAAFFPAGVTLSSNGTISVSNSALLVAGTYTFRVRYTDALGGIARKSVTLLFYPTLDPGSVSAPATTTFCGSGDPAVINNNTSPSGGDGTFAYQWQSSPDNVTWSNIGGATGNTYDPGSISSTTYYRRTVSGGSCSYNSNVVKITIENTLAANTLTAPATTTFCGGGDPASITGSTPTGGSGIYTYQWQSSPDNATWTNIGGATSINLDPAAIVASTYYRRTVTSGSCTTPNNSASLQMVVETVLGNNTITAPATTTFCGSGDPSSIGGSVPTGGNGSYTYQWQSSADNITWSNIAGATSATYDPASISTTTYYRRNVTSGSCTTPNNSASIQIVIESVLGNNTISAPATTTFCGNGDAASITGSTPTGGNGTYAYQWQSSADNVTFADIAGATSINYDPASKSATTYYRRKVTSGSCTTPANSNVVTITIENVLANNTITAPATVTFCGNGDPSVITASAPTGGNGVYTYQWQSSTDNITFTDIAGATSSTLDPSSISATTYYRRNVTSGSCSTANTSNVVTITIESTIANNTLTAPGTVTFCGNGDAANIVGSVPTGGNGTYAYQWKSSTDNVTYSNIGGATSQSYDPPSIAVTTYYVRTVTSNSCSAPALSNAITVTIQPVIAGNTISASSTTTFCGSGDPADISGITPTGGNGIYTYQWQSSSDNITFTDIAGATSISYDPPVLGSTTYYRMNVTSGTCTSTSNVVTITIESVLANNILTAPATTTFCSSGDPANISGSVPTGGNGTYSYQWQSSTDNITFANIGGGTAQSYDPGSIAATTYYRRKITSGSCAAPNTSNVITITIETSLANNTITAPATSSFCVTGDAASISGSLPTGGNNTTYSYQWQSSPDNVTFTNIGGATAQSYDPPSAGATVYYRRNVTSGSCVTPSTSNVVTIVVTPVAIGNNTITAPGTTSFCGSGDPANIAGSLPTNGTGAYAYQWQISTDGGTTWVDQAGVTTQSYDPSIISTTTQFRRNVTSGGCASTSNVVTITINPSTIAGNTITYAGVTTFCGTGDPTAITGATPTGGGFGAFSYQWQSSPDNVVWTNIAGATAVSPYDPPNIVTPGTYYYRREVTKGACKTTSNVIQVTIQAVLANNVITAPATTTFCSSGDAANIAGSLPTGGSGVYAYVWQSSPDNVTFTNIAGATAQSYDPPVSGSTIYFRRNITSGACAAANNSNVVTITIQPSIAGDIITTPATSTFCGSGDAAVISGAVPTGGAGAGTYVYQWQSSSDNITYSDISGETAVSLDPPSLSSTTYYRRNTTSGTCSSTSNISTISIQSVISSNSIVPPAPSTFCGSGDPTVINSGGTPTGGAGAGTYTYKWQSSPDNATWTDIAGATSITYDPGIVGGTIYYQRLVSSGSCLLDASNSVKITIETVIGNNTLTAPATTTFCGSGDPASINGALPTGGNGTYSFQWQSSPDNVTFTDIPGENLASMDPPNQVSTVYFRRAVTSGSCSTRDFSLAVKITIQSVIANDVVTAPATTTFCGSGDAANISGSLPTGGNGVYAYQWQSSTDNSTYSDIVGATAIDYDPASISSSIYYRRNVISGSCSTPVSSNNVNIIILPVISGNTITAPAVVTFCGNGDPSDINGSTPAGGNGTYAYQWQSSADNITYTDIAGATSISYNPASISATTYFHRVVSSNVCLNDISNAVTITIESTLANNTITAPATTTFCSSGDPAVIGGSLPTGGNGLMSYQWESSLDNVTFTAIAGATSQTYDPPVVSATTYFKRSVTSGSCGIPLLSNSVTISIESAITSNTVATSGTTTFCGNGDATSITGSVPSGGNGTYVYQWQSSSDGVTYSDIPGATLISFDPSSKAITTYYRRNVTSGSCTASVASNAVIITIESSLANNIATAPATTVFCSSGDANIITGSVPTGGNGVYSYQWQSSPDNITFTAIAGATGISFDPSPLGATTYFRRQIVSGSCATPVYSNVVTITIESAVANNSITAPALVTFCINGDPQSITGSAPTGGNGVYNFQWQSSTDNVTYSDIAGANAASYDPSSISATTYFKRKVTSGSCSTPDLSNVVTITIESAIANNTITAPAITTLCGTGDPASINGSVATGGNGVYNYQWQSSPDNITFTDIVGETGFSYDGTSLSSTTYYRRKVTSGSCSTADLSNVVTMFVQPALANNTITAPAVITFCASGDPANVVGSVPTGGNGAYVYQWQTSSDNITFSDIAGANAASYDPSTINTTTYLRRYVTSGSCTTPDYSSSIKITINALPVVSAGSDQSINNGGSIAIGGSPTAPGSVTPYSYNWLPSGSLNSATASNPVSTPVASTTYIVTVTDGNGCTGSDNVVVTVNPTTNLVINKTISAGPYRNGQPVTYTITVTNNGPNDATGVSVTDNLPAGVSFTGYTASTGAYVNGTGLWSVGNLSNGGTATLTINGTFAAIGNVTNTATITGGEFDNDLTNNTSGVTVPVSPTANLVINKTAATAPYHNGENVTYTITVTNNGPDAATNVAVSDLLPAGVTYTSNTTTNGTYTSGSGNWIIGNMANGGVETLTIVAKINTSGAITNTATVSGTEFDNDNTNNSSQVTINPTTNTDLSVVKSVSAGPYRNGQNLTYTIVVSNAGPDNATNVKVTDLLPASLTFASSSQTVGTFNNVTGIWTVGALAKGASESILITTTINNSGPISNTATVTGSEYDGDLTNNTSTVPINATPTANLSVTKTVSGGPYNNGQNVTYTITASNAGPNTGTGVAVSDVLPAGLTYVSSSASVGVYNNVSGNWNIGTINNGGSETLTITATVTGTGVINNTATINGTNYDNDPTNNTSTSTINVGTTTDLQVTKAVSAGPYSNGQNVTYTITAKNLGPNNATGVKVTDLLGANLIYVSSVPSTGSYNNVTGIWNIGPLNNGSTETITITATLNGTGSISNTASIAGSDYDPVAGNNSATVPVIVNPTSDLSVVKTVSAGPYNNLQNITYTITATNNGPDNASGVLVNDVLPVGLVFVSASPSIGTYSSVTGKWNIGALANGNSQTLTIVATIVVNGVISNTATISGTEFDDDNTNNTSTSTIGVGTTADLSVTKTVSAGPYFNGDNVTYTIKVKNNGPNAGSGVNVTDLLPANTSYTSSTVTTGTYTSGTGVWSVGGLANGATETLTIVAKITGTGNIINTASVTGNDFDAVNGNNTASVTITSQPSADLSIVKTVSAGPYVNGQNVTYTIQVSNAGPNLASGVSVNDLLPAGLSFTASTPSTGTYNSGTGVWNIGTIGSGNTVTLTITAKVVSSGNIVNSASVTATEHDKNLVNNTSSVTIPVNPTADLKIVKTVSAGPYVNGQNITYTITATNNGPDNASNVTVTDVLPALLTYVSSSATAGAYVNGTGKWTIGALSSGSSKVLTIVANINNNGVITNSASITGTENDNSLANNTSSVTIGVGTTADLSINKVASAGPYYNGANISYTITVNNLGPNNASGVDVTDILPATLTYVGNSTASGSFNAGTGIWTVGTINNGASAVLVINAKINGTGVINNTASVAGIDFDPDNSNNSKTSTINVSSSADLSVTKTVSGGPYNNGQNITYLITATNHGPDMASNVVVTDNLPANLAYVSFTSSTGTYVNGTGLWTIGNLASGATQTLNIVATIIGNGVISNVAVITGTEHDSVATNNTSTSTINVGTSADLSIVKTVSPAPHNNGQAITYTITATNLGPNGATGVSVADLLPSSLNYISSTVTAGTYDNLTGIWTIGGLANGANQVLTITANINGVGNITNTATITGSDFDGDLTNNTSSVTIDANPSADLSVVKTVSIAPWINGQNVTYTISVSNTGPDNATGVVVNDMLASGLLYVSYSSTTGTYNSSTGAWSVGVLPNGSTETLTLIAQINGIGNIFNTATVSGNEFDVAPANNTSTVPINVLGAADLSVTKTVVESGPYNVGNTVTYTITATNNGPNNATGVKVTDMFPAELQLKTYPAAFNIASNEWTIGTLNSGASVSINLVTKVLKSGTIVNRVQIIGDNFDPASANDTASAIISVGPNADLTITKTVSAAPYFNGETVSYAISVSNKGASNATGVVVTDSLPSGLTYSSSSTLVGSYNPATGKWNVGSLANGASATLTINAIPNITGSIINKANVKGTESDNDLSNNNASVSIDIKPSADLQIDQTLTESDFALGKEVVYNLQITNNGPNIADEVKVTDVLPSQLLFISSTSSSGTLDQATGVRKFGSLGIGEKIDITIKATIIADGIVTNKADVSALTHDSNLSNNNAKTTFNGEDKDLFIPEGFSPNNDGVNDAFVIEYADLLDIDLTVFNRWGNKVYYNQKYKNDWRGTCNQGLHIGDDLPDGTYYCVIKRSNGKPPVVRYITIKR